MPGGHTRVLCVAAPFRGRYSSLADASCLSAAAKILFSAVLLLYHKTHLQRFFLQVALHAHA